MPQPASGGHPGRPRLSSNCRILARRNPLVTASDDGKASVWDATKGKRLATLSGHVGIVKAAFSPDGKRIVTTGLRQPREFGMRIRACCSLP